MSLPESTNLDGGNRSDTARLGYVCLLVLLGLFSYTYNLQISLFEGTEGLYGQITREMLQSSEYVRLTYQGQKYVSKPPLFFWIVGGFSRVFGDNEIALRLTGSLFSLGTMYLTFVLGRTLFSWNVGFWAALVFASNHVFLWYGRRVLTDSPLTFFMTLSLVGWVLGSRKGSSSVWYVVTFLGMALATMVKGLHGFALPFLLIVTYSLMIRDFQAVKRWGFWVGGILFVCLMKAYASVLAIHSPWHFNWSVLLVDSFDWDFFGGTGRTPKIPSYLYLIWFDFFPWSVLLPSTLIFLFGMRPFKNNPAVLFVLLWFLGYLLVLCLSIWRREPYLMPLVPPFALTIGYYLVALTSGIQIRRWHRIVNGVAFGILSFIIISGAFFGPSLLQRKWNVAPDFLPVWYLLGFVILCVFLVWTAFRGRFNLMYRGLIALGLCFSFGVVNFFLPAVDAADSPRVVISKIRELTKDSTIPLYHYGLTQEDLIYYLNANPKIPKLHTLRQLIEQAQQGEFLLVTDQHDYRTLMNAKHLVVKTLKEFLQPRQRKYVLLSIGTELRQP